MSIQPTRRRFTVAEYHRMAEAGILSEDDRVELIDGEIIEMTPIGPRHAGHVTRLNRIFSPGNGRDFLIGPQNPMVLDNYSEPQPDLTLLRLRADDYTLSHPGPADILLAIEVAETSAALDRRLKVPLYARTGIAELWLVDLRRQNITVYREPTPTGYGVTRTLRRGETILPAAPPDWNVAVADILG